MSAGGCDGAGQGIAPRRDRAAAMGVTIFFGSSAKKMVGPRRPLRRSITPGTLKRTEQPTLPLRETEDSLGRQVRIRRPSGRPTKEKAARSLRTGSIRCCMAGSGVEWLAARSARRVAPEGAAQGAARPSVTASRSPSPCLPVAQRQTLSRPRRRRLSAWGFD
jgi:hypothetical protein